MAWDSPVSPLAGSHGKSISFDLSPSITHAVGAPSVMAGTSDSPDQQMIQHSPTGLTFGLEALSQAHIQKQVRMAMRSNETLRQAKAELSRMSATESLELAPKKQ